MTKKMGVKNGVRRGPQKYPQKWGKNGGPKMTDFTFNFYHFSGRKVIYVPFVAIYFGVGGI